MLEERSADPIIPDTVEALFDRLEERIKHLAAVMVDDRQHTAAALHSIARLIEGRTNPVRTVLPLDAVENLLQGQWSERGQIAINRCVLEQFVSLRARVDHLEDPRGGHE